MDAAAHKLELDSSDAMAWAGVVHTPTRVHQGGSGACRIRVVIFNGTTYRSAPRFSTTQRMRAWKDCKLPQLGKSHFA